MILLLFLIMNHLNADVNASQTKILKQLFQIDMEEILFCTKLKENIQGQLYEIEMLQSMFANPGELKFDDNSTIKLMEQFLNGETDQTPPFLDFTIYLLINDEKFETCINLSQEYPETEPDIYIRNSSLSKAQHAKINKDCHDYVTLQPRGEPCIFSVITWIQEHASDYMNATVEIPEESNSDGKEELVRLWIYSHHIYSKMKRREILSLANSLMLTGFCLPGKPGIICVEGRSSDCTEWWQTIKAMTWKRIFCKAKEECKHPKTFRRFDSFEEIGFQNSGSRMNHMDMGELYKYLEAHQLGFIFKELFGVDGKSN